MTPLRQLSICAAALWLASGVLSQASESNEWWSLKPLIRPEVPRVEAGRGSNPIDAFIMQKLNGMRPSPEAERRTLIRRLFFDLTGLPPSPERSQRFVEDAHPKAYENLVNELLSSPHYGERWARHWLDVVHYGDTHGYDKDQPRPNAWPYRDYVIRAFNEDKPYSRFVREQIAGDVLFPGADGIEALGFIAAGPWDLIGHAEVPETKIDGKIARHLDRDDMVANTMSTFNSMTVHCAQCHDHKFDPITAEDYYSMQAVFAAVDRTNVEYYREPELNLKRALLKNREREWIAKRKALDEAIKEKGGAELAELQGKINAGKKPRGAERAPEFGYHSAIENSPTAPKWVQVDLGRTGKIERVILAPCSDHFAGIGDGFGFPPRFKIEVSEDPEFASSVFTIHDQTSSDAKNPGIAPQTFSASGVSGRYIRVTAARLAPRQGDYIFALSELEVFDEHGRNLARNASVNALDSIENLPRWAKRNLTDGIYPASKGRPPETELAELQRRLEALIEKKVEVSVRTSLKEATEALTAVQSELAAMPKPRVAFVGAVHHGSGTFRGTGSDDGKPRPIFMLPRGDVRKPGKEVTAGALSAIAQLPARFVLSNEPSEGERRKALALWLTDPRHPLTWRSIVNRVWHYHFGRGIVDTPNDFGHMGARPSHPELLDWLAVEFRDGGQSFKQLHKLIVTSAAYRQISAITPETAPNNETDRENQLLWRMNSRKLEAEAVRDSVLFVSGELDTKMFGPAFQDFVVEKPEHSPHYQYHLHDPDDRKSHRRSIYRFIVRSQQQPFMTTLDCADPSMLVDKRNESLSALQALALLNNGFIVTMARHFAARIEEQDGTIEDQVERAFAQALSRPPAETEQTGLVAFAKQHGLANTCRLILNLNEFTFLD